MANVSGETETLRKNQRSAGGGNCNRNKQWIWWAHQQTVNGKRKNPCGLQEMSIETSKLKYREERMNKNQKLGH